MNFSSSGFSGSRAPFKGVPPSVSPAPPQCPLPTPNTLPFLQAGYAIPSPMRVTQPQHSSHFLPLVTSLKSIVPVKFGSKEACVPTHGGPPTVSTTGSGALLLPVKELAWIKGRRMWAQTLGTGVLVEMCPKGQPRELEAQGPHHTGGGHSVSEYLNENPKAWEEEVKAKLESEPGRCVPSDTALPPPPPGPLRWLNPGAGGAGEQLFSSNFRALKGAVGSIPASKGSWGAKEDRQPRTNLGCRKARGRAGPCPQLPLGGRTEPQTGTAPWQSPGQDQDGSPRRS